jgi:cytochrome c5
LLFAAGVSACTWAFPSDPGARTRRAEPTPSVALPGDASAPASDDPVARGLYLDRCTRCHDPFAPSSFSAREWPTLVARYGPRAGLFGAERARVLAWLQANAR